MRCRLKGEPASGRCSSSFAAPRRSQRSFASTLSSRSLGPGVVDGCPDGVRLVNLAPLLDQHLVEGTVLAALQLPSTTASALDAVVAYLKSRQLLLILDNCEHVMEAAREVAADVVLPCPNVRILATSREALDVSCEWAYGLPSLAVPPEAHRNARDILSYEAIALFVDRALAVNASFALTDDSAAAIAEICRGLDGIPLAIELAAARVKVLAPHQIAQRLDQRFNRIRADRKARVARLWGMRDVCEHVAFQIVAPSGVEGRRVSRFQHNQSRARACSIASSSVIVAPTAMRRVSSRWPIAERRSSSAPSYSGRPYFFGIPSVVQRASKKPKI